LPTFERLRQNGAEIVSLDRAVRQDIRELHIGLLNMMPDAALEVTERQFMALVGNSNKIAQFYVHPFTISGLPRSPESQAYIDTHYTTFAAIREKGLDALIITGANVSNPSLDQEPFWEPLAEVMAWADDHVTSVLCSCLATHALVKYFYGIERKLMPSKKWGVFSHRINGTKHPLLRDINTRFDTPHSRWNEITRQQLEDAGLVILVESQDADVHLVVSPDQFRKVYFQGHPEYSLNSLLKEYKREVLRFLNGELAAPPPYPENYFSAECIIIAENYLERALLARQLRVPIPEFPEDVFLPYLDNTWGDTAKAIVNNWLGLVYKLTHLDRRKLFMDGVDPNDPLKLRKPTTANG
jgi:homoserine O-succinyltransferase